MKVPLMVEVCEESVKVVRNSEIIDLGLPYQPRIYAMSNDPLNRNGLTISGRERIMRTIIGDKKPSNIDVIMCNDLPEFNKLYLKNVPIVKSRYEELLFCEMPDIFYSYPNTDDLKIVVLDIEVMTRGMGLFPNADRDPIIAIGYKLVGSDEVMIESVIDPDDYECEKAAIDSFLNHIREIDPDIIATYNGVKFDIMYLLKRMSILGSDQTILGRDGSEPTPSNLPYRIHWDMWIDADTDQTLLGLPNKRLKTIGYHFGLSDIIDLGREAMSNTSKLVGKPELLEYLDSDVRLTEGLANVYINNHIAMAEMVGIPLREIIYSNSSLIPKVFHSRHLGDKYIGLYTNEQRYRDQLGTMSYESAKVAIYEDGQRVDSLKKYFHKVYKIDFSSQYPTAMDTFNLSPETVSLIDIKTYSGEFKFKNRNGYLWLNIPDRNMELDLVIRINIKEDGFLRSELRRLKELRSKLKALSKEEPDNKMLYSQQWAVKVLMNSIYGYEGLATAKWGDLPVAIATVGLCRWLVSQVEDMLTEHLIETDTDGIYVSTDPNVDKINKDMARLIEDTFGIESRMEVELDEFDDGFFYRTKNYILRENGKVVVKGNAFKSSKNSRVYEKAMNEACKFILETGAETGNDSIWLKRNDLIRSVKDWDKYDIVDFIKHVTLKYDPNMYFDQGILQVQLANQAKKYLNQELVAGDGVDYIVTREGLDKTYTIAPKVVDKSQICMDYYSNEVDACLKALGFNEATRIGQLELNL